jgi:hypothetical protein
MRELSKGERVQIGDLVRLGHEGLEKDYVVMALNEKSCTGYSFEGEKKFFALCYGGKSKLKKPYKVYRR